MQIVVNGREMTVAAGATLRQVLDDLGLGEAPVVAEVDGEIVPRENWPRFVLQPQSRVELVRFVGGG